MKTLHFIIVLFALGALMVPSLVSDSFAGTDNQGRDKGKKISNGCDKGKQDKNNPNCDKTEPFTACDTNGDGAIDLVELLAAGVSIDQLGIDTIEGLDTSSPDNGVIDTETELGILNFHLGTPCVL